MLPGGVGWTPDVAVYQTVLACPVNEGHSVAQRVVIQLLDDMDGEAADETVSFSLDFSSCEIDLSSEYAGSCVGCWFCTSRLGARLGGKTPTSRQSARIKSLAPDPKKVWEWAVQSGKQVFARGPAPAVLVVEFQEAHN